jgi:hypothetical protein
MPIVLNNTQRDFHAFTAPAPGITSLTRTTVRPGFNTLTDDQLKAMKTDSHFMRAVAMDAVIIGGNQSDTREAEVKPLEKLPESPDEKLKKENQPVEVVSTKPKKSRKRKAKKADDAFKDFE